MKYSNQNNIDKVLVASIIAVESRYDNYAVSNKGAMGLMQIMPQTAIAFYDGENAHVDLYNPEQNVMIGIEFLSYLFEKYNDEITVLACYNAGENIVLKWMEGDKYLKMSKIKYVETYNYVKRVQRLKKIYKIRFLF